MLVGDNISSAVTSPLLCALDPCDASHVGQSAGLTAFDASGAVEMPLWIGEIDDRVRLVFLETASRLRFCLAKLRLG